MWGAINYTTTTYIGCLGRHLQPNTHVQSTKNKASSDKYSFVCLISTQPTQTTHHSSPTCPYSTVYLLLLYLIYYLLLIFSLLSVDTGRHHSLCTSHIKVILIGQHDLLILIWQNIPKIISMLIKKIKKKFFCLSWCPNRGEQLAHSITGF